MQKKILLLSLLMVFGLRPATASTDSFQLPNLGEETGALTLKQEQDMGGEWMRQARKSLPILDDPELNAYLRNMGYTLLAQMDSPFKRVHFFLLNIRNPNAFAVPGGYIGINSGLILSADTESQLAGVLAHELAHLTQRHVSRGIADSQRMQWPMLAAMLASILVSAKNDQAGQAALSASTAFGAQEQLRFSRNFEQEADRIGIQALAAAGYDPNGMWQFFEKLQNWSRIQTGNPYEFLSTHPLTVNRIADAKSRAEQLQAPHAPRRSNTAFLHMQTRLRALSTPASEAEPFFEEQMKQTNLLQHQLGQYGLGLVLARKGHYQEALDQLRALNSAAPNDMSYQLALGETLRQAGKNTEAIAFLQKMRSNYPDSKLVEESLAQTLLNIGKSREAIRLFQSLMLKAPQDARLYQELANAQSKAANPVEAHRALAEYYALLGELPSAIDQLEIAKKAATTDFRATAAIDARLNELKSENRDSKKRITQLK